MRDGFADCSKTLPSAAQFAQVGGRRSSEVPTATQLISCTLHCILTIAAVLQSMPHAVE